ncbi:hypothetical protein MMC29_004802 [Sticta canariensis]|nr:hypothetical protein [Sticta canariensis]
MWAKYFASEDSAGVLDDSPGGWFGKDAMDALNTKDDFFVRHFKSGVRTVAAPEGGPSHSNIPDPAAVIVAPCEATPVRLVKHVQARDAFWLKGQPYSILDMLANDELAPDFVGGTVYQAFLSALGYHRWHSSFSGTVVKTYIVPGT